MGPREPDRRDVLRAGMTLLSVGLAGCEELLGEENSEGTTGRTTQTADNSEIPDTATSRTPTTTLTPTATPTPSVTRPTESTVSPPDTPRSSILRRISPEDATSRAAFGSSVAILDNTAFVGSPGAGAVYVFETSGWSQTAKLMVPENTQGFGRTLIATDDTLLVGEVGRESTGAYVFEHADGEWRRTADLTPEDGTPDEQFGVSVALVEGEALVGARNAIGPAETRTGAVYVFERTEVGWNQRRKIFPPYGDTGDGFGSSLAVAAGTLFVGAPVPRTLSPETDAAGSVYAFERTDGEWRRTVRLTTGEAGPGASFGSAISIGGDTVLVGDPAAERSSGDTNGVTYVVERSDTRWHVATGLTPRDVEAGDLFGAVVELADDIALIGAPMFTGSVYVFDRSDGAWNQRAELVPEFPAVNGAFGSAIAMAEGTALIGAPLVGDGDTGAAFVADLTAV
jgi:hypothetical protein